MIRATGVHHLRLTVSNVPRSQEFYTQVLGFELVRPRGPAVVLRAGALTLVLAPSPAQPLPGDRFDPNRVGLDHLSFSLASWADLEAAAVELRERRVPNSGVRDLGPEYGIGILTFEDPDGIQLEFTALRPEGSAGP